MMRDMKNLSARPVSLVPHSDAYSRVASGNPISTLPHHSLSPPFIITGLALYSRILALFIVYYFASI